MSSVEFKGAPARGASDGLFDARSYADWARGAVRIRTTRPEVSVLFDNTIAEPTEALAAKVREAFGGAPSGRYVSVFADGNRFAIAALGRRYGLTGDQIVTTTGVTGAVALAFKALVAPGDEVLIETPGFDVLTRLAEDAGARVATFARRAPAYAVDLAEVRRRLTRRTRAVVITNLHNPTGAWLPPDAVAALAAVAAEAGAVLIVDEVYADMAADEGAPPAAKLGPNVLTASSLTKVFGLFALKFGWLAGDAALIAKIRAAAPDGDTGVSKLSHAVAAHVLEEPTRFDAHWRGLLAENRPLVERHVESLVAEGVLEGQLPRYGSMYFPRVIGVEDTRALARRLYEAFDVLVAPGECFGAAGHIRIGFGADPDVIARGMTRLSAGLLALRA